MGLWDAGLVVRHQGELLTVLSSSRIVLAPTDPGCYRKSFYCCNDALSVRCRPATEDEAVTFLREEAERLARWDAYERKVAERRAAYLARKANEAT